MATNSSVKVKPHAQAPLCNSLVEARGRADFIAMVSDTKIWSVAALWELDAV